MDTKEVVHAKFFPSKETTTYPPTHFTDHPRTLHTLIQTKDVEFGVEEVKPGSEVPTHYHSDSDEVIFIFQGQAECFVVDFENPDSVITSQKCAPGSTFFVPKNTKH